jgi:ABC-type nickel/cobalt efflux system permease component RcnA
MIGAGGMTGALLGLAFSQSQDIIAFVFLAILCTGLTGSARLKLNSQNPMEIYSGFLVGITVMFVIFRMI